jgi:hypothetical protein
MCCGHNHWYGCNCWHRCCDCYRCQPCYNPYITLVPIVPILLGGTGTVTAGLTGTITLQTQSSIDKKKSFDSW